MKTLILLFISIAVEFTAIGQKKFQAEYAILGLGYGMPLLAPVTPKAYGLDLYTQTINNTTELRFGGRFRLTDKHKIEFDLKRTRFKLDGNELLSRYNARETGSYMYPGYTLGNGFPDYPTLAINSLDVNYGYLIQKPLVSYFLYGGLGIAYWNSYYSTFYLRESTSNFATKYDADLKNVIRPTYTLGFRFELVNFPAGALELSIHGSTNNNQYSIEVSPENPTEPDRTEKLSYRSFMNTFSFAVIINLGKEFPELEDPIEETEP